MREQQEVLKHHADPPQVGRHAGNLDAADRYPAAVRGLKAGENAQQGGLARSAGAKKREELALGDLKTDALDRLDGAKALAMTALDFLCDADLRKRTRALFEAAL